MIRARSMVEPVTLAGVPRRVWIEEGLRLAAALLFLGALCVLALVGVVALGGPAQ